MYLSFYFTGYSSVICGFSSESELGFIAKQVNTYMEFAVVCLCNYKRKK